MIPLTRAWLGYDVPYTQVESHSFVRLVRQKGLKKSGGKPEHHVSVGYFETVDPSGLAAVLGEAQANLGPVEHADFRFGGYGIIDTEKGSYVYLTSESAPSTLPGKLKQALTSTTAYVQEKNCQDLYLSIGGPDPFSSKKPQQRPLPEPLEVRGRLILVGRQGETVVRYGWSDTAGAFHPLEDDTPQSEPPRTETARTPSTSTPGIPPKREEPSSKSTPVPLPIHTIAIYPKIQADTAASVFLIQKYGAGRYPGVASANVVFWNRIPDGKTAEEVEADGTLLLDLGGRYDHHVNNKAEGKRSECLSTIIAKDLGIEQNPEIKKLLMWAKRDDLEGKGTVSADPLDRAFGLSGIIMNFNRLYRDRLGDALKIIVEILAAHVQEEYKRMVELPQEWERLNAPGDIQACEARQGPAALQCCCVRSANTAFPGFAKAAKKMDLVIQRAPTGHTNIITQQLRSLDLRPVIAGLRQAERAALGLPPLAHASQATGLADDISYWYYDDAANTLQNGGIDPQGIPPTKLSLEEIVHIVKAQLPKGIIGSLKREKEAGVQR